MTSTDVNAPIASSPLAALALSLFPRGVSSCQAVRRLFRGKIGGLLSPSAVIVAPLSRHRMSIRKCLQPFNGSFFG
jgi:hypothetical protein